METKIIAMLVAIMGSLLVETEAMNFLECVKECTSTCGSNGLSTLTCPFTCLTICIHPPDLQETDQTDYFCKLGCATSRCVPSSSIKDKYHAEKVSVCVDSCSDMCSKKN
ncbi:thionin-like protein 2 [Raphanus sativus]|uniref:Thionin-like protein 2 n=1 Tax=Raphanus sativus TaxID=3726 RepID=A0A9W3DGU9_RAPSA|nr:thionin-like protein 2 [Raphanus sativus]